MKKSSKTTTSRSNTVSTGKLRERALALFQKLRRIEEANEDGYVYCISCGKLMHWKEAQGGHYIPRANRATELGHDNVWPQCQQCNGYLKGNPINYRYRLVRKIGEDRVKRIEHLAQAYKGDGESASMLSDEDKIRSVRLRGRQYYLERIEEYKTKISNMEGSKNG